MLLEERTNDGGLENSGTEPVSIEELMMSVMKGRSKAVRVEGGRKGVKSTGF